MRAMKESSRPTTEDNNAEVFDVYNITSSLVQNDSIVKEFIANVNLLLSASIGLQANYYTSLKNQDTPLMEMRMLYPTMHVFVKMLQKVVNVYDPILMAEH
jgi:hypothetical protein